MTETNYDNQFNEIIREIINPMFKEMLYRKSGQNYYKKVNDLFLTFNYQSSELINSKQFTFNLGVCCPKAYEYCYDTSFPKIPKPWYSIDYIRIGQLVKGYDYWYCLDNGSDLDKVKEEVRIHIKEYVFPYLEKFHCYEDIIEILNNKRRYDNLQFAIISFFNGYRDLGVQELMKVYKLSKERNNEYWIKKCEVVANKLKVRIE